MTRVSEKALSTRHSSSSSPPVTIAITSPIPLLAWSTSSSPPVKVAPAAYCRRFVGSESTAYASPGSQWARGGEGREEAGVEQAFSPLPSPACLPNHAPTSLKFASALSRASSSAVECRSGCHLSAACGAGGGGVSMGA